MGLFKTGSHRFFEANLKIACPLHIAAECVRTWPVANDNARRVESPLWWNLPAAPHFGPASGVGAILSDERVPAKVRNPTPLWAVRFCLSSLIAALAAVATSDNKRSARRTIRYSQNAVSQQPSQRLPRCAVLHEKHVVDDTGDSDALVCRQRRQPHSPRGLNSIPWHERRAWLD